MAEMAVFNPFDYFLEPAAENFPFDYDAALDQELAPFLRCIDLTPKFTDYYTSVEKELLAMKPWPPRTNDVLVAINQKLWKDIKYSIRMEPGVQTPEETLTLGTGSCRDSAWLMVQLLRRLGIAARFVSGYLIQLKADVKSLDGPSGSEVDFTDLHAWCEVYLPGAGWIGLDPTSGLFAGEGHIPLAATPDPQSAAPISGLVEPCETKFEFDMKIERIFETPRVTKPYTEEQWAEIAALGHALDKELEESDVRLTMGGEPTFISIDDMDGPEWNTTAVGPMKARLSDELIKRLKDRFAPGAFLHYGQGKWYPGESLPRWSYGCYWRKDGQPVWAHPHLFADMQTDYGANENSSARFVHALAERLGCGGKWVMPTYEVTFYYLWRERRLPVNVDPLKSNLKDKEERQRLAQVFEQGLGKVVGHVLPLKSDFEHGGTAWSTGPWFLRGERCYSSRATLPSACVCLLIRSLGSRKAVIPTCTNKIRWRTAIHCHHVSILCVASAVCRPRSGRDFHNNAVRSVWNPCQTTSHRKPSIPQHNRLLLANLLTKSCALRSAWSRATASSSSSCRRRRRWRSI